MEQLLDTLWKGSARALSAPTDIDAAGPPSLASQYQHAGIGENSPEVRAGACANLGFVGLKLNSSKNAQTSGDREISPADSAVRVLVVHAQEDWAIARKCWRLVSEKSRDTASVH
jgi:hypothetical protein